MKPLTPEKLNIFKKSLKENVSLILICTNCEKLIRNVDPDDYDEHYHCPYCGADSNMVDPYGTEA